MKAEYIGLIAAFVLFVVIRVVYWVCHRFDSLKTELTLYKQEKQLRDVFDDILFDAETPADLLINNKRLADFAKKIRQSDCERDRLITLLITWKVQKNIKALDAIK